MGTDSRTMPKRRVSFTKVTESITDDARDDSISSEKSCGNMVSGNAEGSLRAA